MTAAEGVQSAENTADGAGENPWQHRGPHDRTGVSPRARAWRTFLETSAVVSSNLERHLQSHTGLKLSDYNFLLLLAEAEDGCLRMGDLAERMVFSPSRLSYQAKVLEARGLITRCPDTHDRRGMMARLTDQGRDTFRRAAHVHAAHIKELFHAVVDEQEAEELQRICLKIQRNASLSSG
ncbi:MarR family winged helix-turn-helix transcriptional regulator [Nesterenkonia aerolata]|uniref:MarR family winged helix-turn-helix transcriptional regulator n=1 Tax=Nesterenkonia aerolata TaxID=3074079 RepID=A0ABU2DN77_9MICC|nr:MarR family winged helix-turn-helix transcriptional regulator [Nesterenkonia sp. LY-0111]MDR8017958.1 MarR family winged helix-turn-helix transcriptional regulator [Nesterenkonia sp. LY-0111]